MSRRLGVIALTGAIVLSGVRLAYAAEVDPTPSAETASSLPLRPSKPLTLAPEPRSSGFGFSGFAAVVVAAAGLIAWKRHRAGAGGVKTGADSLAILRRTSVGVRSELVVVETEGKRLLLGVTPTSIKTLSVLADADEEATNALVAGALAAPPRDEVDEPAIVTPGAPESAIAMLAAPSKKAAPDAEPPLEGQVRGLAALGRLR